ncbi:hypothetical protein VTN02DRAFT_3382 [Thermoascus thermophilus]
MEISLRLGDCTTMPSLLRHLGFPNRKVADTPLRACGTRASALPLAVYDLENIAAAPYKDAAGCQSWTILWSTKARFTRQNRAFWTHSRHMMTQLGMLPDLSSTPSALADCYFIPM